jgi:deoxyribodipyrimidine photolyase
LGGQRGGGRASGRMTTTSIVWFRRDQRLTDNPAWALGTQSDHVVPLFVIDPALFDVVSDRRRSLLVGGLRALDRALARHGGRLRVDMATRARWSPPLPRRKTRTWSTSAER